MLVCSLNATALIYVVAMIGGSRNAAHEARGWLERQGIAVSEVMAGPVPVNPFVRDVIALGPDRYHFVTVNWLGEPRLRFSSESLPLEAAPGPIVRAALAASSVRGLAVWMRYPTYEVTETPEGYRVLIRDVRYSRRRGALIGTAVVELDKHLAPRR